MKKVFRLRKQHRLEVRLVTSWLGFRFRVYPKEGYAGYRWLVFIGFLAILWHVKKVSLDKRRLV